MQLSAYIPALQKIHTRPFPGGMRGARQYLRANPKTTRLNKLQSSPRFVAAQMPDWLLQSAQQIQVIDYELHASLRTMTRGQMRLQDIPVFLDACIQRERLMAKILTYLAERRKAASQTLAARNGKA